MSLNGTYRVSSRKAAKYGGIYGGYPITSTMLKDIVDENGDKIIIIFHGEIDYVKNA